MCYFFLAKETVQGLLHYIVALVKWLQITRSLWLLSILTDHYDYGNTKEIDGKDS